MLRGIGRLTGGGFLEQMAQFITDLNDLFGGFRERASQVAAAFRGGEFGYVIVTTPAPMAIREAMFFAERLEQQGMQKDAFVINRVHRRPRYQPSREEIEAALQRHQVSLGPNAPERLLRALSDELSRLRPTAPALAVEGALSGEQGQGAPVRIDVPALPSDAPTSTRGGSPRCCVRAERSDQPKRAVRASKDHVGRHGRKPKLADLVEQKA